MFRVIMFLTVIGALALAGIWLADRPGAVAINWMGWRIETSVAVAAAIVAITAVLIALLWSGLRLMVRSPRLVSRALRQQRARKGQKAIARGLVAVASGDAQAARKFAATADRIAGDDPLVLLLRAQTAQLSGNRAGAEQAFRAMTDHDETRLLGLRGLFVEAQRQDHAQDARRFAEEAARAAPALPWAGQAVFESYCAEGNWVPALRALESQMRNNLVDRTKYRRLRAVLLTAQAQEAEEGDPSRARAMAAEASKLAPGLVPAAVLGARLGANEGDWRKGAKLLEAAWRLQPHPDIAELYAHLRPGGSARDRLARIRHLTKHAASIPEAALARARAALEAKEFASARSALAPMLTQPTRRVALLMAELEQAESGHEGRAREWIARAVRAAPDHAWTADGMVSDRWMPVSPVTGRLDAFEWKAPLGQISHSGEIIENMPLPSGAEARWLAAPEASVAVDDLLDHDAVAAVPPGEAATQVLHSVEAEEPVPAAAPEPAAPPASSPSAPSIVAQAFETPAESLPHERPKRPVATQPRAVRADAVIPMLHAPDDPGPEPDPDAVGSPREPRPLVLP